MSVNRSESDRGVEVPQFNNLEEEAKFFDNTSFADIAQEQIEEIEIERPRRPRTTTFAIRLDFETVEQLREIAKLYDMGPTQLARMWVKHRIDIELQAGVLAPPITTLPADIERRMRQIFVNKALDTMATNLEEALEQSWRHVRQMGPELMNMARAVAEQMHQGTDDNADRIIDRLNSLQFQTNGDLGPVIHASRDLDSSSLIDVQSDVEIEETGRTT